MIQLFLVKRKNSLKLANEIHQINLEMNTILPILCQKYREYRTGQKSQ